MIIIPVFLEESDDIDEVMSTSSFDQVWKVVNALRAHDEILGEELDQLRRALGTRQQISLKGTKLTFDLPVTISREFINALECKVVEMCSNPWEAYFSALELYVRENGSSLVPRNFEMSGLKLGVWVADQRTHRNQSKLSETRIERLNALGFVWDVLQYQWELGFAALAAFAKEYGHCIVKQSASFNDVKLGQWITVQRQNYRTSRISDERVQRLEAIGFVWDAAEHAWEGALNL